MSTDREEIEKTKYGIKYKVTKLDNNNFLMFPICLVKGYEGDYGFKTDTEILNYAENKDDLKRRYVVDKICDVEELKTMYQYDEDNNENIENVEKFLVDYFYEDNKEIAVLANTEEKSGISKLNFPFKIIADQSCDAVFCMSDSIPYVVLNEKAMDEILECKDRKKLETLIKTYQNKMKDFKEDRYDSKTLRVYIRNGHVHYIDTEKTVKEEVSNVKEAPEVMIKKEEPAVDESGVSYNGLRKYLKERVYGHDNELDTIAQKIYMNYTAIGDEPIDSILIVGPSGTGKTETVTSASNYLNLPYATGNAANLIPQGIRGTSLEDILTHLYENAGKDIKKAEKGIVFLDEFDKLDTKSETKAPVKDILLTFTGGGIFKTDNQRYELTFDTSRITKMYAGVFERISETTKSMGFNQELETPKILGTSKEIRDMIIDKKYFTLEEISRITTILAYNDLDKETKKKALVNAKAGNFPRKKARYKRQFGIDLVMDDSYIDAIIEELGKHNSGMRILNNCVGETLNTIERKILEEEVERGKQLVLTRDTVSNPNNFLVN